MLSFQAKNKIAFKFDMIYESILSNQGKLCLNSYEQQLEIDGRINRLTKALETTDAIKSKTEATRNNLKEKLNTHLNALRTNLNNLEKKFNQRLDTDISQKMCDSQLRVIESDVNQLIGNLRNMSMLNDSQKLLVLKSIDLSINQLESNISQMESNKSQTFEKLTTEITSLSESVNVDVDGIEKAKKIENSSVLSLTFNFTNLLKMNDETKKMLGFNETYNYKDWLLKSSNTIASPSYDSDNKKTVLHKTDSFEVLSGFTQGDFELISDTDESSIDCDEYFTSANNKNLNKNSKKSQVSSSTLPSATTFFSDIYSKPMECWLLPRKQ